MKVRHSRFSVGVILFALAMLPTMAQERAAQIREKLLNRNLHSVIVVSHRADWRNFPENSLEAIESAIRMGVDVVELDLQRTKDGKLILMHDSKLDRTTTGKGKVSDWTLDSIKTLRLKNGCNIKTIHKVPTLEEALLAAKGKIMINLDKADRYFDQVYELLQKTGTTEQIIMKGSKPAKEVKARFGKYLDEVIYMPIVNLDKEDAKRQIDVFVEDMRPAAFELLFVKDSNPLPRMLADSLKGDMSLANPDEGYGYLIDVLGCRIIQTDRPAYLLDYLRKRGLHD